MKTDIKTVAITRYAKDTGKLFRQGYVAQVHSVYRNTVNLLAEGQLFSLQNDSLPLSPMGMGARLDEQGFDELSIERGMIVYFTENSLTFGSIRFLLNPKGEWDPCLAFECYPYLEIAVLIKKQILEYLKEHWDRCGFQNATLLTAGDDTSHLSATGKIAFDMIQQVRQYAANGKYATAGKMAAQLMGLGPGLTPSGDDFLIGLLSALRYLDNCPPLGEMQKSAAAEIEKTIQKTNDISAALLKCACRGELADVFHPLYCAVSLPEAKKAVDVVGKMGHSSGGDTLSGIYFGLSLHSSL